MLASSLLVNVQPAIARFPTGVEQVFVMDRSREEIVLPMIFGSASPPHQIFIFIFNKLLDWPMPQIREQIFANTLDTLAARLEVECADKFEIPIKPLLDVLKQRLRNTLDEETKSWKQRPLYSALLDRIVGETTLSEYEADEPAKTYFTSWWNNVRTVELEDQDLYLVGQAQLGEKTSIDDLHARHRKRVAGYIRPRVNNDADADDITQETWTDVWRNIQNYDPIHGNFESFLLYWARYKILQANKRNRRWLSVTVHEADGPENDITTVIDSLTAAPPTQAGDRMISRLLYRELVKRAFSGANPPHQLIVFGFCKLLELKPKEVVADLSNTRLSDLAMQLEREYFEKAQVHPSEVEKCFAPLHARMALKVDEVLTDSRTSATRVALQGQVVGDTVLRNYYGDNPEGDITSWWDTVRRRVRNEMIKK